MPIMRPKTILLAFMLPFPLAAQTKVYFGNTRDSADILSGSEIIGKLFWETDAVIGANDTMAVGVDSTRPDIADSSYGATIPITPTVYLRPLNTGKLQSFQDGSG